MKDRFRPVTNEHPLMIILGIICMYLLVSGFVFYFYFLKRISLEIALVCVLVFTIIYFPRLVIIKKIQKKDYIKILDSGININNKIFDFNSIQDFRVEEKKPSVVFFINNQMVVFKEAVFYLKLDEGQVSFSAIGSEKIKLLKEFLTNIING